MLVSCIILNSFGLLRGGADGDGSSAGLFSSYISGNITNKGFGIGFRIFLT